MKITINVDCTPEEARRYMGLPDVALLQDAMLKQMQEYMLANFPSLQPADMMKAWLPMDSESWQEMQKAFWAQLTWIGAQSNDKS